MLINAFELVVEQSIQLYEAINGHNASVTRQMIQKHGAVVALSRLVVTSDLQQGFKVLRDSGELDKTFEAIVLRFQERFPPEVVEAARWRLEHPFQLL